MVVDERAIHRQVGVSVFLRTVVGLSPGFLVLHVTIEGLTIQGQPLFISHFGSQVDGETVRIVQDKGV